MGKRSFNRRSTPSRLSFTHLPLSHYHHLRPCHPISPSTACYSMAVSPSPLLRDVGLNPTAWTCSEMPTPPHLPLPFPEGCGQLGFVQWRNGGGGNTRGDPGYGRPTQCITKTNHDERRGSFSSFPHAFNPTDNPSTQRQRKDTRFPNPGVTDNATPASDPPSTMQPHHRRGRPTIGEYTWPSRPSKNNPRRRVECQNDDTT